jgi:hypothetical protein
MGCPSRKLEQKAKKVAAEQGKSIQTVRKIIRAASSRPESSRQKYTNTRSPSTEDSCINLPSGRVDSRSYAAALQHTERGTAQTITAQIVTSSTTETQTEITVPGVPSSEKSDQYPETLRPFLDILWSAIRNCETSDPAAAKYLAKELRMISTHLEETSEHRGPPPGSTGSARTTPRPKNKTETPTGKANYTIPKKLKLPQKVAPTDRALRSKNNHQQ